MIALKRERSTFLLSLLLLALLYVTTFTVPSAAQSRGTLVKSNNITSYTVWTPEDSPYIITGSVWVSRNATLVVQPGTTIVFEGDRAELVIEGSVVLNGSNDKPIIVEKRGGKSNAIRIMMQGGKLIAHNVVVNQVLYFGGKYETGFLGERVIASGTGHIEIVNSNVYGIYIYRGLERARFIIQSSQLGYIDGSSGFNNVWLKDVQLVINDSVVWFGARAPFSLNGATNATINNSYLYSISLILSGESTAVITNTSIFSKLVVQLMDESRLIVRDCIFRPSSVVVVDKLSRRASLDLRFNWWGSPTGPYIPGVHEDGRGARFEKRVALDVVKPWLVEPPKYIPVYSVVIKPPIIIDGMPALICIKFNDTQPDIMYKLFVTGLGSRYKAEFINDTCVRLVTNIFRGRGGQMVSTPAMLMLVTRDMVPVGFVHALVVVPKPKSVDAHVSVVNGVLRNGTFYTPDKSIRLKVRVHLDVPLGRVPLDKWEQQNINRLLVWIARDSRIRVLIDNVSSEATLESFNTSVRSLEVEIYLRTAVPRDGPHNVTVELENIAFRLAASARVFVDTKPPRIKLLKLLAIDLVTHTVYLMLDAEDESPFSIDALVNGTPARAVYRVGNRVAIMAGQSYSGGATLNLTLILRDAVGHTSRRSVTLKLAKATAPVIHPGDTLNYKVETIVDGHRVEYYIGVEIAGVCSYHGRPGYELFVRVLRVGGNPTLIREKYGISLPKPGEASRVCLPRGYTPREKLDGEVFELYYDPLYLSEQGKVNITIDYGVVKSVLTGVYDPRVGWLIEGSEHGVVNWGGSQLEIIQVYKLLGTSIKGVRAAGGEKSKAVGTKTNTASTPISKTKTSGGGRRAGEATVGGEAEGTGTVHGKSENVVRKTTRASTPSFNVPGGGTTIIALAALVAMIIALAAFRRK